MPSTKVGETIGFFTQSVLVFMVHFSFEIFDNYYNREETFLYKYN